MKQAVTTVWCMVLAVGFASCQTCWSAEEVWVQLNNGRRMTATIHQRTNQERLWLQYGTRSATVIRPVNWQMITAASHNGQKISVSQLKELASRAALPAASSPPAAEQIASQPVRQRVLRVPPASEDVRRQTMADRVRQSLGFRPRVSSVRFDAGLANWDGDVENDGLLVDLVPLDDHGNAASTSGTLQVEFVAMRQRDFNDVPTKRGLSLDRIGRWTVQVDEADFRQGVATVKLPFQAAHPEFDTDWFAAGLVHVRFAVAGDGTFEQSIDGVRTRPFAPLRDALQLQTGRRFLEQEQTARGKRSAG